MCDFGFVFMFVGFIFFIYVIEILILLGCYTGDVRMSVNIELYIISIYKCFWLLFVFVRRKFCCI